MSMWKFNLASLLICLVGAIAHYFVHSHSSKIWRLIPTLIMLGFVILNAICIFVLLTKASQE